ncbi:MAG TPA: hypothetical protein VLI05_04290 [Candidatus Saccharimonadia bacterium]|nr:hypothetical protein [Candidatus Saccharimonadia bacterium]
MAEDQQLINRIIYLASLASELRVIDPMLDRLRGVTASYNRDQPLQDKDRRTLQNLEGDLKSYLITQDPVRSFTAESLAARLKAQMESGGRLAFSATPWSLVLVLGLSVVSALLAFLLPVPRPLQLALTIPLYYNTFNISIGWFYLSALRNFKDVFRRAFTTLTAGVICFGVAILQYSPIQIFDLTRYPVFKYGGLVSLLALCGILMYHGLRRFALLLGIKHPITSWRLLGGLVAVAATIMLLVPHPEPVAYEGYFRLSVATGAACVLFCTFMAGTAYQIMKHTTEAFRRAMVWFFIYAVSAIGAAAFFTGLIFALGELKGAFLSYTLLLAVFPQFVQLYAGYVFKKETAR